MRHNLRRQMTAGWMAKRGSRRKAAANRKVKDKPVRTGWRLWLRRFVITGLVVSLLGALFLGLAVAFAA
ncbi:MAG: hypothetical protein KDD90_04150, partial [Sphingomonadaceae bacterium]|nr:hypothetical protein [Sphingomonadaceae bacterium]